MSPHGSAGWLALILIDFYQRHDKVIHLNFLLKPSSSHRRLQQDERLIHVPLLTGAHSSILSSANLYIFTNKIVLFQHWRICFQLNGSMTLLLTFYQQPHIYIDVLVQKQANNTTLIHLRSSRKVHKFLHLYPAESCLQTEIIF